MKAVMIDQDGVVYNEHYVTTADLDFNRLLSENVILIPNSDTPLARLVNNFEKVFGVKPRAAIAENGAVVLCNGTVHYSCTVCRLQEYRRKIARTLADKNFTVLIGDSTTMVQQKKKMPPNCMMAIIDKLRERSISLYLFKTDTEGNCHIDDHVAEYGLKIISAMNFEIELMSFNYNKAYGIAIAGAADANKSIGYHILRELLPGTYFMIGDSDSDVIDDLSVVHCCVANSTRKLIEISRYSSPFAYTEGLSDCLEWIYQQDF